MSYQMPPLPTLTFPTKQGHRPLPQILGLQIAAKLLQIATWAPLTAYRNLPTPCPTVQLPTPCRHLFFQNRGPDTPPKIACCQAVWSAILATAGFLVYSGVTSFTQQKQCDMKDGV